MSAWTPRLVGAALLVFISMALLFGIRSDFEEKCHDLGGEPIRGVCIDNHAVIEVK